MKESWTAWAVVLRRHPDLAESFFRRDTGEVPLFLDGDIDRAHCTAGVLRSRYPGCNARVVKVLVQVEEVNP